MEAVEKGLERMSMHEASKLESELSFPVRPEPGKSGKGIRLHANYLQVFIPSYYDAKLLFAGYQPARWRANPV
jgi:hypothetical protein